MKTRPDRVVGKLPAVKGVFFCISCNDTVFNTAHFREPGHSPRDLLEPIIDPILRKRRQTRKKVDAE